jgi:L-fuculose-phosphate aldolase
MPTVAPERELRAAIIADRARDERRGDQPRGGPAMSARTSVDGIAGFLITPTGIAYDDTTPDDIVAMTIDGTARGDRLPSSEWRFHRDLYRARDDFRAIVHVHAPFATTLACLHRGIPAFHYEVAFAGGADIRCAPYATFGSPELATHAVAAMADRRACLLANHGMIAAGKDLASALALAVEVEGLAEMYWRALQLGKPQILSDAEMDVVVANFRTYGQPDSR